MLIASFECHYPSTVDIFTFFLNFLLLILQGFYFVLLVPTIIHFFGSLYSELLWDVALLMGCGKFLPLCCSSIISSTCLNPHLFIFVNVVTISRYFVVKVSQVTCSDVKEGTLTSYGTGSATIVEVSWGTWSCIVEGTLTSYAAEVSLRTCCSEA